MHTPTITKNIDQNEMTIERTFNAPREKVWDAWTQSELLDRWWAPKPWKAVTKSFEFTEGGKWLYKMEGPDGTVAWTGAEYKSIDPHESFTAVDYFCNEEGVVNEDFPITSWSVVFREMGEETQVIVTLSFKRKEDMDKLIEMGFEEGFTAGLSNLDELLAEGF